MKHDMVRTTMMFPKTEGGRFDMDYFLNKHVPMVRSLLEEAGLLEIEVEEGVPIPNPGPEVVYAVLASLTFNSFEALERAMRTHGATFKADAPNFTNIQPQIQVNQVKRWSYEAAREHMEKEGRR